MGHGIRHQSGIALKHVRRGTWRRLLTWGIAAAALLLVACGPSATATPATMVVTATPGPTATPHVIIVAGTPIVVTATPGPTSTPVPTVSADAGKYGGTAIFAGNMPDNFNPLVIDSTEEAFSTPILFNGLMKLAEGYAIATDLAESWEVSADGLTYTFRLRDGTTWNDGQPFTAADVKFSWETACHPDNIIGNFICSWYNSIEGVDAFRARETTGITGISIVDDLTVQVKMARVFSPFVASGAGYRVIPKHIWGDVEVGEMTAHPAALGEGVVGTGAFIIENFISNDSIIMRANETYFDGRPYLDRFIWRVTGRGPVEAAARVSQLKLGELNAMGLYGSVPTDLEADVVSDPNLRVVAYQGFANLYIAFSFRDPLFQDLRIRKAISYATNRQSLKNDLYGGHLTIFNGPIHPGFAWTVNPDTPMFDNDVDASLALFAAAGWTKNSDGILEKDGQTFSFVLVGCCGLGSYGPVVQQQWLRVGVDATLSLEDPGAWLGGHFFARTFVGMGGLNLPYGNDREPNDRLVPGNYFHGATDTNPGNYGGWKNARADELMDMGGVTADQNERQKIYHELAVVMANDVPHLFLGITDDLWGISGNLVIPADESGTGLLALASAPKWYFEN